MALWILWPGLSWAQTAPEAPQPAPTEASCLHLGESIMVISSDVEDVELERALEHSMAALEALDCQTEPVSAMLLTNLLQIIGAVQLYSDDADAAAKTFAWAVNASPTMKLSESYGEEALAIYRNAQVQAFASQSASLTVTGDVEAWVNGNPLPTGSAQELLPGTHLVQWRQEGQPMTARVIDLLEGVDTKIALAPGLEMPPELQAPVTVALPTDTRSRWLFRSTSLASIAGGTFLVVLASQSHELFDKEMDPDDLPELQTRTNALASTGIILVASGLAVGTFSFTFSTSF
jgi:hypothetical protein